MGYHIWEDWKPIEDTQTAQMEQVEMSLLFGADVAEILTVPSQAWTFK